MPQAVADVVALVVSKTEAHIQVLHVVENQALPIQVAVVVVDGTMVVVVLDKVVQALLLSNTNTNTHKQSPLNVGFFNSKVSKSF
jgi:hypothetical protein